jgi:hypothetical protein
MLIHFFLQYEVQGSDSTFFVDDRQIAVNLASINKKITTIQGYKVRHVIFVDV